MRQHGVDVISPPQQITDTGQSRAPNTSAKQRVTTEYYPEFMVSDTADIMVSAGDAPYDYGCGNGYYGYDGLGGYGGYGYGPYNYYGRYGLGYGGYGLGYGGYGLGYGGYGLGYERYLGGLGYYGGHI
ncbi:hypothetical protein AVEN_166370-1 [Araneus ventricosus]|uniref:Uncharacterized protein n=1 Tax=Araneus ventricosus TaxID=182803 RepID=A0A4Y2SNI7_ARAVE|nr:hypothetical protein AVEN_166370-1 [Araneus ventricosus]